MALVALLDVLLDVAWVALLDVLFDVAEVALLDVLFGVSFIVLVDVVQFSLLEVLLDVALVALLDVPFDPHLLSFLVFFSLGHSKLFVKSNNETSRTNFPALSIGSLILYSL